MRFLCVNKSARANIFGQEYELKPLDPRLQNIEDILVTDNFSASELFKRHPDVLLNLSFDRGRCKGFPRMVNTVSDIDRPGNVLILRNGGIGDHVLFLPALRIFRRCFPRGSKIWLSTQKEKHPIFTDNRDIDRLLSLPLRLDILLQVDYLIDFSERDDLNKFTRLHMTDYFLDFLSIDYTRIKDKAPRISWDPSRSPGISKTFEQAEDPSRPRVLLNWTASNALREFPPEKLLFLVETFKEVGFVVAQQKALEARTRELLRPYGDKVLDLTAMMRSLDDYLSVIALCDAVVTTDTAAYHLAEALGKPSLVLFGPTRDELWIRYYKRVKPLRAAYSGSTCRSPCGIVKSLEGCPESRLKGTSFSPCLMAIPRERIRLAFTELLQDTGS
ncbi:MAG: glycosyltransferase family 9 protein [Deltaproteobacteria bacterium]|nr:glycosyltransferase family 9 protein [Deltaproteobacteria bacterium]